MRNTCEGALDRAIGELLHGLGTPKSLAADVCFNARSPELFKLRFEPSDYDNSTDLAVDYLAVSVLSKIRDVDFGIDQERVAFDKWKLAEDRCREMNEILRRAKLDVQYLPHRVHALLFTAQRKIAQLIGDLHTPKQGGSTFQRMLGWCRWGPGATSDLKRHNATLEKKITLLPWSCTRQTIKYAKAVVETDPHWFHALTGVLPEGPFSLLPSCFEPTAGNRLVFVDKDAKTKRTISAEPTLNSFLQQGVGRYFRKVLRRVGIDLDDQSLNQRLAKAANSEGLATLDLSMASDTISKELVTALLPFDWAVLLDDLRSKAARLPNGDWHNLEKFSSMGNAFTFELETIIFWALSSSALELDGAADSSLVSVYGDDIVVPRQHAAAVVEALEVVGFSVNHTKSYTSGRFFESCGKHYAWGDDVTPFYQRLVATSDPAELIRFANRLVRWSLRVYGEWRHHSIRRSWETVYQAVSSMGLFLVPLGIEGDRGFLVPRGFFIRHNVPYDPNRGYRCNVLDAVPAEKVEGQAPHYAYWLRRRHEDPRFTLEPSKVQTLRYKKRVAWLPPIWEVEAT